MGFRHRAAIWLLTATSLLASCSIDLVPPHQGLVNRDAISVRPGFPNLDPPEPTVSCGETACGIDRSHCVSCNQTTAAPRCIAADQSAQSVCHSAPYLSRRCTVHPDCGSWRLCIYRTDANGVTVRCELPDPKRQCSSEATLVCETNLDCRRCKNDTRCSADGNGIKRCLPPKDGTRTGS